MFCKGLKSVNTFGYLLVVFFPAFAAAFLCRLAPPVDHCNIVNTWRLRSATNGQKLQKVPLILVLFFCDNSQVYSLDNCPAYAASTP